MNILDKMKRLLILFISILSFTTQSQSLPLSEQAEVSLITCGPGTELYAAFGHTAFRVRDPKVGFDRVYNYGTFDFNDPNFYANFTKGDLRYFLSAYDFGRFLRTYHKEKRWVTGQVLNLQQTDVQKIFDYLENNAKRENREYFYDYFFNNCSTKPYDVIVETIGEKLVEPEIFNIESISHRQLTQPYLKNLSWGDFGIDLGLGSPIDRKATPKEYLFLPENVLTYFDAMKIVENGNELPIVKRTENILLKQEATYKDTFFTPLITFSVLALLVIIFTFKNIKQQNRSRFLDFLIFFITGLIGMFLLLTWFGTNHISARDNYNTLWAFAPNLVVSFFLFKKKLPNWVHKYCLIALIVLLIGLIVWILQIQVFSIAVLPLIVLLAVRYIYLWKLAK
ncbi:MAG: DUF4105 domain-containing protein [Urechidicola sp.]|nr:DUF4105 domain-containing protein [Urechidicola sp.]